MKKAEIILRKQARKDGYKGKELLEFIKNPTTSVQEIKAGVKRGRPKKNGA